MLGRIHPVGLNLHRVLNMRVDFDDRAAFGTSSVLGARSFERLRRL